MTIFILIKGMNKHNGSYQIQHYLPSSAISPFVIRLTRTPSDGRFGSENVTFKMETTINVISFRLQTQ